MKRTALWSLLVVAALAVGAAVAIYRSVATDDGEYHPPGKLEPRIAAQINACNPKAECRIRLGDVTSFEWDEAYVFDDQVSRSEIETILHTSYPQYAEMLPNLIFI